MIQIIYFLYPITGLCLVSLGYALKLMIKVSITRIKALLVLKHVRFFEYFKFLLSFINI